MNENEVPVWAYDFGPEDAMIEPVGRVEAFDPDFGSDLTYSSQNSF